MRRPGPLPLALAIMAGVCLAGARPAAADVVPRDAPAAGSVIARKSGEEVRFIDVTSWRFVDVSQDLLAGDVLRTNALGHLAVLFADRTQVRLGRNTTLLVKAVGGAGDSRFGLESGTIWARAERGGIGLTVDTPAAAAAIRGTDWTMTVGADGRTSLIVLEGVVELSNAQGSVTVRQGEAAYARIGQKPTRTVLVDLREREQILLYGELRNAFAELPATGRPAPADRAERRRVLALRETARTAEDWLALAETGLSIDGRAASVAAMSHLRRPLPGPLEARARLVEAMIAGQQRRYRDAERLFRTAMPGLGRERRATAAYGAWFAGALADPDRPPRPPSEKAYARDPAAVLARAAAANYVLGPAEAIDILKKAERRFPHDARLPAMRADLALQLDRREEVKEALALALAIDPDDPSALLTSARFRATVSSDLDGALRELNHAAATAPGADAVLNEIGIVQDARNAVMEADAAYRRSIELNPENPVLHANYARFLMDHDQLAAARREVDAAVAIDPESYAVLAAKGRYLMRIGRKEEAEEALLQASVVNPAYAEALIGLAIVGYQMEDAGQAEQSLDNADRLDSDDPGIPLIRSGIAVDQYRADDAIADAREALRRRFARGGFFSGYDANRQASSFLGVALDNLGLDEWGRFYADKGFDPFIGSSYIDQAAAGRVYPFVAPDPVAPDERTMPGSTTLASQFQGLLLDPLAASARTRRNDLERSAFAEATLGGGFISEEGKVGWQSEATLQGLTVTPMPVAYYLRGHIGRPDSPRTNDRNDLTDGDFAIGMHPSLADSIVLFGNTLTSDIGYPGQVAFPTPFDNSRTQVSNLGAGWSHVFGEKNVLEAFVVGNFVDASGRIDLVDAIGPYRRDDDSSQDSLTFGVGHLYGVGPLTFRYGVEATAYRGELHSVFTDLPTGFIFFEDRIPSSGWAGRVYGDVAYEASRQLLFEAGLHPTYFHDESGNRSELDPRFGVAWAPAENHWLRAMYREDTQFPSNYTLAPVTTVGLTPFDLPLTIGGHTKTATARWEAEWTPRFFTALEYQHQSLDGLSLDIPDLNGVFDATEGTIDRFAASANVWIGHGLGGFATFSWNETRDRTPGAAPDQKLPLVPDYFGQVGLTFVHPSRVKVSVAESFVGRRLASPFGDELDPYVTTDASLTWSTPDNRIEMGLQLLNAFDADYELANDIPGPGRTILGSIKARF